MDALLLIISLAIFLAIRLWWGRYDVTSNKKFRDNLLEFISNELADYITENNGTMISEKCYKPNGFFYTNYYFDAVWEDDNKLSHVISLKANLTRVKLVDENGDLVQAQYLQSETKRKILAQTAKDLLVFILVALSLYLIGWLFF